MGLKRKHQLPLEADDEGPSSSGDDLPEAGARPAKRGRGGKRGGSGQERPAKSTAGLVSSFFQPAAGGSGRGLADVSAAQAEDGSLRAIALTLPPKNGAKKAGLRRLHEAQFGRWRVQWRSGNSLLLYGFGSKRALLEALRERWTSDGAAVTVDGLARGVTARVVLAFAAAALKNNKPQAYRSWSRDDLLSLINGDDLEQRRLYLFIHNLDGPGLRDMASQRALSQLAAHPRVHLAATVDHANATLMWDLQTRDRFNWALHNVTNYEQYGKEVAYASGPSLLAGGREGTNKQAAGVVLASLSHSAREVFRLIADQQLDTGAVEQGIAFQDLFQRCRERFLCSSATSLRAILQEFRDHELLAAKRGEGGGELLHVPLADDVLGSVLEELDHMS